MYVFVLLLLSESQNVQPWAGVPKPKALETKNIGH